MARYYRNLILFTKLLPAQLNESMLSKCLASIICFEPDGEAKAIKGKTVSDGIDFQRFIHKLCQIALGGGLPKSDYLI